jgi:hypothetical protein
VQFGTYLGATETGATDSNPTVRVMDDGTAVILTSENGPDAPFTANAYQRTYGGGGDLLIAKISDSGQLLYCSYLGGSAAEFTETHSMEIDSAGNAVIVSATQSANYPVTDGSTHKAPSSTDIAISILSSDGSALLHSSLYGGTSSDEPEGVGIDGSGNIYVTGHTSSRNLTVTNGALSSTHIAGENEGLLLVLSPELAVRYASYDGIPGEFANRSMTVGIDGWSIVGSTWHMNPFPSTATNDSFINGTYAGFFRVLTQRP